MSTVLTECSHHPRWVVFLEHHCRLNPCPEKNVKICANCGKVFEYYDDLPEMKDAYHKWYRRRLGEIEQEGRL